MTVLRAIEQKIESLVEGVFGRAFRASVQPAELARKLVKEMDEHKLVSVSRVYVPDEYTIYLSSQDREQLGTYEDSVGLELQDYLAEHARREGYAMLSPPAVLFRTDGDLEVGEFGIATRMVERGRRPAAEIGLAETGPAATIVYRSEADDGSEPAAAGTAGRAAALTVGETRHELAEERLVLGRSRECDVQLADANVSRRHAELRREGAGFFIVDLGSTNGIEVNGRRTSRARLEHGDRITLGSTELVFEALPGDAGQG